MEINCEIYPNSRELKSIVTLYYKGVKDHVNVLLNPGFIWKELYILHQRETYEAIPRLKKLPDDSIITVANYWEIEAFGYTDKSSKETIVHGEYEGPLTISNWDLSYIKNDFVELALYGAWYPIVLNNPDFTYVLRLKSDLDWIWVSNSHLSFTTEEKRKRIWHWVSKAPTFDVVLIGQPEKNAYHNKSSIFWGPKDIVEKNIVYENQIQILKKKLVEWLGVQNNDFNFVYVFTPRNYGGQDSRTGLIATINKLSTEKNKYPFVLQSILHEICHFWFNKNSLSLEDNWLDEALAEFCSNLIISENLTDNIWLEQRAKKALEIIEKKKLLPSINETIRKDPEADVLYYHRGFLIFWDLYKKIGPEIFKKIIKDYAKVCVTQETASIDSFLRILKDHTKDSTIDYVKLINNWINLPGKEIPRI